MKYVLFRLAFECMFQLAAAAAVQTINLNMFREVDQKQQSRARDHVVCKGVCVLTLRYVLHFNTQPL